MISFKKSYAEQLLQLALALSLLRVDPENYFGFGWESLSLHDGGVGWQLELRAAPLTDYPYANRKALMPLIEDLARFRHTNPSDVTAYLLNVQSGETQTEQSNITIATTTSLASATVAINHEPPDIQTTINNFTDSLNQSQETDDLFLNFDHFNEQESILEQNIADLSDYGDIALTTFPFLGMPLKDEPPELPDKLFEIKRERGASTSFTSDFGSLDSLNETHAVIDWKEYFDVKSEVFENETVIKQEKEDDENSSNGESGVELTEEVSFFFIILLDNRYFGFFFIR